MTALEVVNKKPGERLNGAIDMSKKLVPGDFLDSVTSVVAAVAKSDLTTPAALTIGTPSINAVQFIHGKTQKIVPPLTGVLFQITGGSSQTLYKITVTADSVRGEIVIEHMYLQGID